MFIFDATQWASGMYTAKMNDDVIKAFKKFDKDDSGAIDKDELGELC